MKNAEESSFWGDCNNGLLTPPPVSSLSLHIASFQAQPSANNRSFFVNTTRCVPNTLSKTHLKNILTVPSCHHTCSTFFKDPLKDYPSMTFSTSISLNCTVVTAYMSLNIARTAFAATLNKSSPTLLQLKNEPNELQLDHCGQSQWTLSSTNPTRSPSYYIGHAQFKTQS